ncbi:uncharacterized protein [Apostichopus japonicus]|uniref:uncharacterized protein isoform X3 n=1 Tax=Stichopus japonicus TaxID=307972 RepID=UPI003AB2A4E4
MTPIQSGTKDKQISDLEDKIDPLKERFCKGLKQSEVQAMLLKGLQELHEMLVTEIKKELKELHKKTMKHVKEMTVAVWENRGLNKLLEEKQDQKISDLNQASCEHQFKEEPQGILEVHLS